MSAHLSRRTALGGIAALLAAPAAVTASPAVLSAIAAHKAAWRDSGDAWAAVYEIEQGTVAEPTPRVQIANHILGKDDNGNDILKPIYAYSEEDIIKSVERDLDNFLAFYGRSETGQARLRQQSAERLERKLADFREQQRAVDEARHASGLAAAEEIALDKDMVCEERLQELVAWPCASLADARAIADLLSNSPRHQITDGAIEAFVRNLAGAAA